MCKIIGIYGGNGGTSPSQAPSRAVDFARLCHVGQDRSRSDIHRVLGNLSDEALPSTGKNAYARGGKAAFFDPRGRRREGVIA